MICTAIHCHSIPAKNDHKFKIHFPLGGTQYCWTELQCSFLEIYDNKKDGRVMIIAGLKVRNFKDARQEIEI